MDNVTHALVGVTLAELALPASAPRSTRRVLMTAAVVAASAPDLDLIYTGLTAAPLGYLLHHRGHSHTWPGLVVLGMLIMAALRLWPSARLVLQQERRRFVLLLAAGLASHLVLDAFNGYGTHLLYPLTTRWYFGDAVFIFEPWIWLMLGVSVACNGRHALTRIGVGALVAVLLGLLVWFGLVTVPVSMALALGGAGLLVIFARMPARVRASVALGTTAAVFVGMFSLSFVVKADARRSLESFREGAVVDIMSNPNPAVPWCWTVMSVAYADGSGEMTVRRGTLSLLPSWTPAESCASHRLTTGSSAATSPAYDGILWSDEWRGRTRALREAFEQDCWARAWFQFGRVPFIVDDRLVDLRFENPLSTNFSAVRLGRDAGARGCPSNLTNWEPPRVDVLGR